ncbi:hypothetical protein KO498_09160 [Lentibacter algarum]|uniref:DNA polymerase n=1 Tax=Lentibacter algarum TaxID=576131 RepID=UPI001C068C77|nr:DNA polymerase [Lentibacter algarum]MBU2981982.1 hypothetical protein [Lentibacter algarum]
MSIAILSFIKSYSKPSSSKYYLTDNKGFREATANEVCSVQDYLVTHDYWMICQDIYEEAGCLPPKVIDLDEFHILTSPDGDERKRREKVDAIQRINRLFPLNFNISQRYKGNFYGETEPDLEAIEAFHEILLIYYIELCRVAHQNGEFHRFFEIEVPCQNICSTMSSRGIKIHASRIADFRLNARHDYYTCLRELSDKFDVPLEIPSREDIISYATSKGVDTDEYGFEFVLNFMPQVRDFCETIQRLRELDRTRGVLDSLAVRGGRVHPVLDTQGSRTSRISARSPYLQSLAKRYRSILVADPGYELGYVDFDQFEVGIMAALSGDAELHRLFSQADMYESFRIDCLKGEGDRKAAKIMFLAYAYGMKLNNLPIIGAKFGISRNVVRSAFKKFGRYEEWKQETLRNFDKTGFVATSLGNRFFMKGPKATKKERLSAISQVVQGEGSLIFKKALIEVYGLKDIELLLPMHDALLFQSPVSTTLNAVIDIFVRVIGDHFDNAIEGKASAELFAEANGPIE